MPGVLRRWLENRKRLRLLVRQNARELLTINPSTAYYDAHRLAARARFSGDHQGFAHWSRVAWEVARISDNPMDLSVVEAIVAEEQRRSETGISQSSCVRATRP